MKNTIGIENMRSLKRWQQWVLIIVGALVGGAAAYGLLRWWNLRSVAKPAADSSSPEASAAEE